MLRTDPKIKNNKFSWSGWICLNRKYTKIGGLKVQRKNLKFKIYEFWVVPIKPGWHYVQESDLQFQNSTKTGMFNGSLWGNTVWKGLPSSSCWESGPANSNRQKWYLKTVPTSICILALLVTLQRPISDRVHTLHYLHRLHTNTKQNIPFCNNVSLAGWLRSTHVCSFQRSWQKRSKKG